MKQCVYVCCTAVRVCPTFLRFLECLSFLGAGLIDNIVVIYCWFKMGWNTKPKVTFEAFSSSNISTITIKNLQWNWTLFNKMHIFYHLKHLCFKKRKRNLVCHSNFTATIRIKILKVPSNKLTFLWQKLKFTAYLVT